MRGSSDFKKAIGISCAAIGVLVFALVCFFSLSGCGEGAASKYNKLAKEKANAEAALKEEVRKEHEKAEKAAKEAAATKKKLDELAAKVTAFEDAEKAKAAAEKAEEIRKAAAVETERVRKEFEAFKAEIAKEKAEAAEEKRRAEELERLKEKLRQEIEKELEEKAAKKAGKGRVVVRVPSSSYNDPESGLMETFRARMQQDIDAFERQLEKERIAARKQFVAHYSEATATLIVAPYRATYLYETDKYGGVTKMPKSPAEYIMYRKVLKEDGAAKVAKKMEELTEKQDLCRKEFQGRCDTSYAAFRAMTTPQKYHVINNYTAWYANRR